ncbi:MAG: TonB-dependent receptor [Pseudomonadota bacterium]|nr:TonB-dependent receptor [Pseudomonadota bacterium]
MNKFYIGVVLVLATSMVSAQQDNGVTDEIIVSSVGQKSAVDIISSTDIVDHITLDKGINRNIGEILEQTVGIENSAFGRAVGQPIIRGLGSYRIKVLENGLSSADMAANGADHPHAMNALSVSRIEVLKGPSSLRYGPFSASGVINMLSEHQLIDENTTTGGDFLYGNSSVAKESATHFHSLIRSGNMFWGLSGYKRDSSDYKIPGYEETEALHAKHEAEEEEEGHPHEEEARVAGTAKSTAVEDTGINFHATWLGNNNKFTYFLNSSKSLYGIPGHEHEEEEGEEEHHEEAIQLDMERTRYGFEYTQDMNGFFNQFLFNSAFTDYEHGELEGIETALSLANQAQNIRMELLYGGDNTDGVFGYSSNVEDVTIGGEEAGYIPSHKKTSQSLFLVQNVENGNLLIEGAARLENNELDVTGNTKYSKSTNHSFSVGSGLKLSDNSLIGASIAQNSRAPSVSELYAEGTHFDAGIYEKGNSQLEDEKSNSIEVYYRYNNNILSLNASYYNNDYNSFIYRELTGAKISNVPVVQYRQKGAEISGIELELDFAPVRLGNFDVSNSFMISKVDGKLSGGGYVPRIPPLNFQYTLDAMSDNWLYTLRYRHSDKQDSLALNEMLTDSYNRLDFEVRYEASNGVVVSMLARNIGDEDIRNHTSWLKDKLPEPGRDYNLSVQYSF